MVIIYKEESTSNSNQNQEIVPNETASSVLLDHKHNCSLILHKDLPEVELPQNSSHPSNNTSKLGWNNHNNTQTVDCSEIIKTLREMVKRVVMEFRRSSLSPLNLDEEDDDVIEAVPISFRPPQPTNFDMMISPKKRVTTLLVGETLVSFELPYNCRFSPEDLDMLAKEGMKETTNLNINEDIIYNMPRYTSIQRLNGWKLEKRQRVNGRFDTYYHHVQSRRVFRSITEVVNFFLYEVYPDKLIQKSATKSKLAEDESFGKKLEGKEKTFMPLKRKFEEMQKPRDKWQPIIDLNAEIPIFDLNDDDNECQVSKEETVHKFLAESYDNLLDLPDCVQKSEIFNFDINKEIVKDDHTVEEFMSKAYNNLMNSSKNEPNPRKEKEKEKGKGKEKITYADHINESLEVQKAANSIPNAKHKRLNIKVENGNVIFTDIDCEPWKSRYCNPLPQFVLKKKMLPK